MTLDAAVMLANSLLLGALLAVLLWKRTYRTLPTFTAYISYSFLAGLVGLALAYNASGYRLLWGICTAIDTFFYLCVLVESGRAVLRYNRTAGPPKGVVFLLIIAASVPLGLFAQWPDLSRFDFVWQITFRVMQATSVLEVAGLLALAWWSGLSKLRWPERELRLVMGMGAWAIMQLSVLVLHEHGLIGPGYHWLDLLTPAVVLGVMVYWLHFFWFDAGCVEETWPDIPDRKIAGRADARDDRNRRMRRAEQE